MVHLKGLRDLACATEENFTNREVSMVGSDQVKALMIVIEESVLSSTLA